MGRVSPDQKRDLVLALQSSGHTVAMLGDGVNDVLALKVADLGIAIGGGSAAARAVAAVILLDGSFEGLPQVLQEGRRVIGNVEPNVTIAEERTMATMVMGTIGLWVLYRLTRPLTNARRLLLLSMAAGLGAAVLLPPLRVLFDLYLPRPLVCLAGVGLIAFALLRLEAGDRLGGMFERASRHPAPR